MPDSGIDLGADLYALYRMGKHKLPTVAAVYRTAGALMGASAVESTTSGWQGSGPRSSIELEQAFIRSMQIDGTLKGPACAGLLDVLDTIARAFNANSDNLEDTADNLLVAVQVYSEEDELAACELERLKQENGE